jgi:hypothetical protein
VCPWLERNGCFQLKHVGIVMAVYVHGSAKSSPREEWGKVESVVCRYDKLPVSNISRRIDSWEEIRGFAINITAVILGCIGEFPPPPYLAAGSALRGN